MFSAAKKNQTSPFLAEVCFFNASDRRDILTTYLREYFVACQGGGDDDEDGEESDHNPAIKDEVANVMVSLFKDRPECRSKKDVRQFLEDAKTEDEMMELLEQLVGWSDDILRRRCNAGNTVIVEASTAGELLTLLESYATETVAEDGSAGASLWPLVSVIRFHFSDPLTDLGLSFLDTPGLSDHNKTRRLSALKHARWKTHALVVTDAGRAGDDPTVSTEVRSMAPRGPDRVVIVIPKSDIIGDSLGQLGNKKERQESQQRVNKHKELEKALESLDNDIQNCEDDDDSSQFSELTRQKGKLEVLVKRAENADKAFRIHLRSEATKVRIHEKLTDVAKTTREIPVFSVSNKVYNQHLAGFAPKKAPVLGVEETGIPDLRRLLFTFPNEARLNEAKHRQHAKIPSLLSRLRLYTSRTPLERKADMEKYVLIPLAMYETTIREPFDQFTKTVTERIIEKARAEESSFIEKAHNKCVEWEDQNKTGAFHTLMKRRGHRKPTKRSNNKGINMSQELIDIKAKKMASIIERSTQYQRDLQANLLEDLLKLTEDMISSFKADPNYSFVNLQEFIEYLRSKSAELRHYVENSSTRILTVLKTIEKKVTLADDDSYLVEAMADVFTYVAGLKATRGPDGKMLPRPMGGWPQYRKDTFKQKVIQIDGIWAAVYKGIEKDLIDCTKAEMVTLTEQIGKIFKDFRTGFDMRCEASEVTDPQEQAAQDQLAINLDKAEKILKGDMRRNFDSLWQEFRTVQ